MEDKIKQELEEELDEIYDSEEKILEKIKILNQTTNDSKFKKTNVIAILALIPSLIAVAPSMIFFEELIAFPMTACCTIGTISSIALGYITQALITSRAKEKTKEFSNFKNNKEILEEISKYEIEIEKNKNKENILNKIYDRIDVNQNLQNNNSFYFHQSDKYEKLSFENLIEEQEKLTSIYNEKLEQLDILTKKMYLEKKLKRYSERKTRIGDIIWHTFLMNVPFWCLIGCPLALELNMNTTINNLFELVKNFMVCYSPSLIITPLALPYLNKRNKDYISVFNNLNQSLEENVIFEEQTSQQETKTMTVEELTHLIKMQIEEIVEIGIKLKKVTYIIQKRELENASNDKGNGLGKNNTINRTVISNIRPKNEIGTEDPKPQGKPRCKLLRKQ